MLYYVPFVGLVGDIEVHSGPNGERPRQHEKTILSTLQGTHHQEREIVVSPRTEVRSSGAIQACAGYKDVGGGSSSVVGERPETGWSLCLP